MVSYFDKVKKFLFELGFDIQTEDAEEGLVVITDEESGISNLIIDCEGEILIFEQFIFKLKTPDDSSVLKKLLQINRSLVHGALVLDEEDRVIFRDTLQLENMDQNEIEATINSIGLMMAEYANDFLKFTK
ncbi:YbjN domain-containing protein [Catalinimonas niigatensis]|uniref:YbjN domain-containing protein n=1 Tax=Catalinimonas niigatensis TaxID=1397264 RepID=UPI0026661099|nr:YbjN domain-containing protein [Catalinimonas niigatensis]WPP48221.1 YbjN domain-containing protein [Catalinimonas niigatensis]